MNFFFTAGPEQSFKQLLPEFSSQESQHADLPSIYSIEARGASQGRENHDYSEQTEILQNKKKGVHFQSSTNNQSPGCSSPDGSTVFNQLHLRSSPGSSTSMLGFEELLRKVVTLPTSQRLTQDKNEAIINPPVENSEGSHSLSVQNEMSIQNRFKTETTNPSQVSEAEHITNSFPSSIPVWVSVFCKTAPSS